MRRGSVMQLWLRCVKARIKLRRLIGIMRIIDDLSDRLIEAEQEITTLDCDKVDVSDGWAMENDIVDIQERLDKLER